MNTDSRLERSCGAVVYFRTPGGIRYVLVCSADRRWGFPKGHMEAGETERETALREIREETGLEVRFTEGFTETDEHPLAREGRRDTIKRVTYFLAACDGQQPHPMDTEIAETAAMDCAEALSALENPALKRILTAADAFLRRPG